MDSHSRLKAILREKRDARAGIVSPPKDPTIPNKQEMLLSAAGDDPQLMQVVHTLIKDPSKADDMVRCMKSMPPKSENNFEEEGLPPSEASVGVQEKK